MTTVISVEHLSKAYRLGQIGTGTFANDLKVWWAKRRGMPNPMMRIGESDHGNRDGETLWALKDVSFTVEQGEVLGIIGRNGAGKSTLLKILSRVTAPTSGRIRLNGRVASLLEVGTGFHPELTGRENIYLNGTILGMNRAEIDRKFDEIVDFSGVEQFIDTPVKRYSSGMYVRLAFAVAAYLEPEILVVDEVLAVGDAEFQKKCLGKMGDVAKGGRTVLFVSHNMAAIENLCRQALIIDAGRLFEQGDASSIIGHYFSKIMSSAISDTSLENRTDRTGNKKVVLTSFFNEDLSGNRVTTLRSGMDVYFVFAFKKNIEADIKNVDIGFSVHTEKGEMLFVLYSSYVNQVFNNISCSGFFRCLVSDIPLSPGRYRVGARITVNAEESDWPKDGVGFIEVESSDFYKTGSKGFNGNTPFLIRGDWTVSK